MAYVGTPIDTRNQFQSLQGKRFNGDGSTTDFTLDVAPSSTLDIEVFVGNVRQDPNSAYTVSGTTLSFTGAPPSGTNNIYVVHQAKSVGTIDVPDDIISGKTLVTLDNSADHVLIEDATDGELKKALIPAASFAGIDDQTSSNDDQLTITDTAVVINEDSDDVDFRVESNGNANMLFVDGGNNRVLIGSATSVAPLSLEGALQISGTSVPAMSLNRFTADEGGFDLLFTSSRNTTPGSNTIVQDNDELGAIHFCADDGTDYATQGAKIFARINGTPGANDIPTELVFSTTADGANSPTERFRILNDGTIATATTSVAGSFLTETRFGGNPGQCSILSSSANVASTEFLSFRVGNTQEIGSIKRDGGGDAIAFNTSSDYRLKQDIVDIDDGITRLKTLQPRKFKWKSDTSKTVDGFIAHEVTAVPESITGTKDETENKLNVVIDNSNNIFQENVLESDWTKGKADGTFPSDSTWSASKTVPKYQQIDQAKLVPLLTAALQEAVTKIEALEARVTTLEG